MYYVYVLTNLINGKKYVGFSNDPQRRLLEHRKSRYPIGKGIRKYGLENFSLEVIHETFKSRKLAGEKEIQMISLLNSLRPNGYNLTKGGDGLPPEWWTSKRRCKHSKKMKKLSQEGKILIATGEVQREYWASISSQERSLFMTNLNKERFKRNEEREHQSKAMKEVWDNMTDEEYERRCDLLSKGASERAVERYNNMTDAQKSTKLEQLQKGYQANLKKIRKAQSDGNKRRWAKHRLEKGYSRPDDHLYLDGDNLEKFKQIFSCEMLHRRA